ncbi:threonine protein kinase [Pelomyxa schiedti]|nr:threonine protein kinase [Pelomyxa schiedti]
MLEGAELVHARDVGPPRSLPSPALLPQSRLRVHEFRRGFPEYRAVFFPASSSCSSSSRFRREGRRGAEWAAAASVVVPGGRPPRAAPCCGAAAVPQVPVPLQIGFGCAVGLRPAEPVEARHLVADTATGVFTVRAVAQAQENESGKFCQKGCNYRKILDNVLATPPTLSKNKSRVKLVIEAKPPQITNDECPSVPTTPVAGGPSYAVPTKTIETNLGGTEGFTLHSSVSGKTYKQCLETTDEFRDKIEKGKHALVYFVKDEKNNIYIAKSYPSNDLTVTLHEELRHPNVERVLEHFQWTGRCWGVYEYCEQGSIVRHSQMVTRSWPPLSASRLWLCCRDLSCGLLHIHSKNVINCDIKLPNIFVTKDLRVVIGDFSASKRGPIAYTVAGTRAFNAPETTTGNGYGKEVDIWSTAVVIYGLCQGSLPCADVEKIPQCRPETLEFRVPIHPLLQDLLKRMFEPAAPKRITAQQMMEHPWITQDGRYPMSNIDSRAGLDSNIEQWLVSYKSP